MSSIIFPIRGAAAAETTTPRPGGLLIPLRTGGGGGSVQQRDQEVFKAVAAAVAVTNTGDALQISSDVRTGAQNPGTLFQQVVAAAADLEVVVAEVRRIQAKRSGSPDDEQRIVAAAVGADAVLVAAAVPKLKGDATGNVAKAALAWAAAVDAQLLERAAHAAAKSEFLDAGVAEDDIKKLQDSVKKLQDDFAGLDKRVTAIENAGQQQSAKRGGPSPSGG